MSSSRGISFFSFQSTPREGRLDAFRGRKNFFSNSSIQFSFSRACKKHDALALEVFRLPLSRRKLARVFRFLVSENECDACGRPFFGLRGLRRFPPLWGYSRRAMKAPERCESQSIRPALSPQKPASVIMSIT
jgi:hypothetical protein